ncbi:hypothetical protein E3N88_07355 [Mikania micrantha]|uniref:Uncharacterized protein n=1 Tax=Mikania micrantha TaxID=192012 RepID=A0A5N6PU66_9ASTR|nr:hypothetical protein E3N88_07355 [Mikania micrantha]
MANKIKQDQSLQQKMNNYEKTRLLRVQENKERLRELGVKSMAKSLTSLVESKKKKKRKVISTDFNMRDDNYSNDMSDDSDKNNQEVAANVQVEKKQHRPRYIAPMCMTKIANVAKQRRVIAPNVLDSNVRKDHHSKAALTLGELISRNKGTRQKEIFKKNLANPACIKHRSDKHLVLEKYDVLDAAKTWVLKSIGQSFKKNDDPHRKVPTLTQLFERTRKRTEGRAYVDIYDDTARKIEQMENYKATENENTTVDPFLVVMNKENYGYRRLYGRCVTNTLIKKVEGHSTSYMITEGLMESFKANVDVEKNQLLEMRKEIEDDHERKKIELEAMREDIDRQRQNLEAMMQKVIKQLPVEDRED